MPIKMQWLSKNDKEKGRTAVRVCTGTAVRDASATARTACNSFNMQDINETLRFLPPYTFSSGFQWKMRGDNRGIDLQGLIKSPQG